MTDRQTDRQTDGRTDARGKTICLPTLSGGDIMNVTQVKNYPNTSKPKEILNDEIIKTKTFH